MDQSTVRGRLYYLIELGHVTPRNRVLMIRTMTWGQMEAIAEICRAIVNANIPLLNRDFSEFRSKVHLLSLLASTRVSLERKKRALLRHHAILTRLLRPIYLSNTMVYMTRAAEE